MSTGLRKIKNWIYLIFCGCGGFMETCQMTGMAQSQEIREYRISNIERRMSNVECRKAGKLNTIKLPSALADGPKSMRKTNPER
jgi:hypothetical protein